MLLRENEQHGSAQTDALEACGIPPAPLCSPEERKDPLMVGSYLRKSMLLVSEYRTPFSAIARNRQK
jgi:hypothetical protein